MKSHLLKEIEDCEKELETQKENFHSAIDQEISLQKQMEEQKLLLCTREEYQLIAKEILEFSSVKNMNR